MPDIKVRVGQQNAVKVVASAFGGSLTAENAQFAVNVVGGIASVTQLNVNGISTFGGSVHIAGITTLAASGGITTTGGDLFIGGSLNTNDLSVAGVATFGTTSVVVDGNNDLITVGTGLTLGSAQGVITPSLFVSGVSTFIGNVDVDGETELDNLNISGITTFNDDVVFQGAAASQNITFDHSENDLEFSDLARAKFGNNDDLEIWHGSGNNSHIKNSTNDLKIRSDSLILKRADDSEPYLKATVNSDVKIYYNGNEKFATTKEGVIVSGGTTTGSLNVTGVSTFAGYVGLSTGLTVAGVTTFNQDVQFPGAAYNILWDQATSKFKFDDSAQAVWGSASGGDLKIFHQSGNSTIRNETGQFRIAGNDIRLQTQNHSEDYLLAVDGGSVSIFHNDVKRLETTPSGVNITDTLNVAGVSTFVGDAQFDGNVSIAGTLTKEDVTNIDSVGLITARSGVRITAGGLIVTAGVSTFNADVSLSSADLSLSSGDVNLTSGDVNLTSGDLNAGADILVADNIRHKGDTDTYIEFTADRMRFIAGGKALIDATESGTDTVVINEGSNDLNFRVEGQNDEYQIFSDGATDKVGIGSAIPTAKLDVAGDFNVSGVVTATQLTGLIDGGTYWWQNPQLDKD